MGLADAIVEMQGISKVVTLPQHERSVVRSHRLIILSISRTQTSVVRL